jgi:hypothetical protein
MGACTAGAATPACDRACLERFVNQYLEALVACDAKRAPLRETAKYTENRTSCRSARGRWKTAEAVGSYRIYIVDPQAGQVGFIGTLREAGLWGMIALRLRIIEAQIAVRDRTHGSDRDTEQSPC